MLPNYLVIGAMKAGTTSLHRRLAAHPEVFASDPKELKFFVAGNGNWHRGIEWYESHFAEASGFRAAGEASPRYSKATEYPGVPARIAEYIPDARIIYLVREPISRMRSHYLEGLHGRWEARPLDEALRSWNYIDASRYSMQLDAYLEHFDRGQVLVLTSERLRTRPQDVLGRVAEHLGVADEWPGVDPRRSENVSSSKDVYSPRTNSMRGWKSYRVARRLVPRSFRSAWSKSTARRVASSDLRLSDSLAEELRERLEPDVARLRREWFGGAIEEWPTWS